MTSRAALPSLQPTNDRPEAWVRGGFGPASSCEVGNARGPTHAIKRGMTSNRHTGARVARSGHLAIGLSPFGFDNGPLRRSRRSRREQRALPPPSRLIHCLDGSSDLLCFVAVISRPWQELLRKCFFIRGDFQHHIHALKVSRVFAISVLLTSPATEFRRAASRHSLSRLLAARPFLPPIILFS
jgi:hypothetical protein